MKVLLRLLVIFVALLFVTNTTFITRPLKGEATMEAIHAGASCFTATMTACAWTVGPASCYGDCQRSGGVIGCEIPEHTPDLPPGVSHSGLPLQFEVEVHTYADSSTSGWGYSTTETPADKPCVTVYECTCKSAEDNCEADDVIGFSTATVNVAPVIGQPDCANPG